MNKLTSNLAKELALMFLMCFSIFVNGQKSSKAITGKSQLIRLQSYNVNTPDLANEAVIYFDSSATSGYDALLEDLKIMYDFPGLPDIYTIADSEKLAVNAMPFINGKNIIIPIGIKVTEAGDYVIKAYDLTNIPSYIDMTIIDNENNTEQNIKLKSDLRFYLSPDSTDNGKNRFSIKFSNTITSIDTRHKTQDTRQNGPYTMFSNNNVLNITLDQSPQSMVHSLVIYNLAGESIYSNKQLSESSTRVSLPDGVYIVRLMIDNTSYTRKIYIK